MRQVLLTSRIVLGLSVMLWTAGRIFGPLPDWAVRANGVIMMIAAAALVFSAIRLKVKSS